LSKLYITLQNYKGSPNQHTEQPKYELCIPEENEKVTNLNLLQKKHLNIPICHCDL